MRREEEEGDSDHSTYTTAEGATGAVWIADGRNVAVRVRAGRLEVIDGVTPQRRTRSLGRADAGSLAGRVVVLGAGYVTTEAMTWCHLVGLPLLVARTGPTPTMLGGPVLYDHGGMRRAQALTSADPAAFQRILGWLLDRRICDEAGNAERLLGRPDQARRSTPCAEPCSPPPARGRR